MSSLPVPLPSSGRLLAKAGLSGSLISVVGYVVLDQLSDWGIQWLADRNFGVEDALRLGEDILSQIELVTRSDQGVVEFMRTYYQATLKERQEAIRQAIIMSSCRLTPAELNQKLKQIRANIERVYPPALNDLGLPAEIDLLTYFRIREEAGCEVTLYTIIAGEPFPRDPRLRTFIGLGSLLLAAGLGGAIAWIAR